MIDAYICRQNAPKHVFREHNLVEDLLYILYVEQPDFLGPPPLGRLVQAV